MASLTGIMKRKVKKTDTDKDRKKVSRETFHS